MTSGRVRVSAANKCFAPNEIFTHPCTDDPHVHAQTLAQAPRAYRSRSSRRRAKVLRGDVPAGALAGALAGVLDH